jgi:glyoxylase-like metal-dependent hydrolase (beta-lactamase superfamily II)
VGPGGDEAGDRAVVLCDARGTFPEPIEHVLPGIDARGDWPLHVHCFLLLVAGQVVLVDAGAGPTGAPAAGWLDHYGHLLDDLAEVGIGPADVTHVVLTHLHVDHVGWTVREPGTPTFPNARHVVQEAELVHLGGRPPYEQHVRPLREAGLLQMVDGAVRVLPNVDVVLTPGHTPGHQSVVAQLGDLTLVMAGDVFVHPAQVRDPRLAYRHESDQPAAAETRRRMLRRTAQAGTVLAPSHFPSTMLTVEGSGLGAVRVTERSRCRHAEAVQPVSASPR